MEENGFKKLNIRDEYHSLEEDVVRDFFIPVLNYANKYDRAAGFFSSSGLAKQTVGLCSLVKNNGKMRVITSPKLSEEDIEAIDEGYKLRDVVIKESLIRELVDPENEFEEQRLNLLANLIASGILDIRIAVLRNEPGIFHDKFGIFTDVQGDSIAYRGSMNESENAFFHNYETIDVYNSWDEYDRVESKKETFEELWRGNNREVESIDFPEIKDEIIKKYKRDDNIDDQIDKRQFGEIIKPNINSSWLINIPSWVEIRDYQKAAVDEWEKHEFRGIFDMATGTGKTFTALAALERFEKRKGDIFAIVVCPYIHLVDQWADDAEDWGVEPIICHSQSPLKDWRETLKRNYRRYRNTKRSFMCIVTNDTFTDETFQSIVKSITEDMNAVLVVDEVHNFGASSLSKLMPNNIKYRLGLSATVERYGDADGTKAIFDYFGEKCIDYPLQRAIKEHALVQYEYYPILCSLTKEEEEEYERLTKQISKQLIEEHGKKKLTEIGKQLLFKRSRLVAGAEEKVPLLKSLLEKKKNDKYILVYCGATKGFEHYEGEKEKQIDIVEKMIGNELGMSTHRFTADEDGRTRRLIKEGFADGDYQVVTAIKCLDEGVNIPNIQTAYILASSRNPKEFIQRRGRVLRTAKGKERAVIYDFVTLPRPLDEIKFGDYEVDRSMVIGELSRVYEFGRYSINSRIADEFIDDIMNAYDTEISEDELLKGLEAYDDE